MTLGYNEYALASLIVKIGLYHTHVARQPYKPEAIRSNNDGISETLGQSSVANTYSVSVVICRSLEADHTTTVHHQYVWIIFEHQFCRATVLPLYLTNVS